MTDSPNHPRQVDRLDFAAYVQLWRERFGATHNESFDAVAVALDGQLLHPFTSFGAMRIWLRRDSHSVQMYTRKAAIECENKHTALFEPKAGGILRDPLDSAHANEGGTLGGILPVPSAANGLHTETRREVRKSDRSERDRFIRETIARLTVAVERDPKYVAVIIRKYAEAIGR